MPRNDTSTVDDTMTDILNRDSVDRVALARLDLDTTSVSDLAAWLHANGAAHLSQIERIELAERLITRRRFIIGAGVLGLGVLTGCEAEEEAAPDSDADSTRVITDALGNEVAAPTDPQRVALVGQGLLLHYVSALGVKPLTAPVDYGGGDRTILAPPEIDIEGIEPIAEEAPSLELLVELNPDLIIASDTYVEGYYDELAQIAPTVALSNSQMFTDWRGFLLSVGEALNRQEQAQARVDALEAMIESVRTELSAFDGTVSMATVYPGSQNNFAIWDAPHPGVELLTDLGVIVVNGLEETDGAGTYVSAELFTTALTGDVLFLLQNLGRENEVAALEAYQDNPLWQQIPAVQNDNVYLFTRVDFALNPYSIDDVLEQITIALVGETE